MSKQAQLETTQRGYSATHCPATIKTPAFLPQWVCNFIQSYIKNTIINKAQEKQTWQRIL